MTRSLLRGSSLGNPYRWTTGRN